MSSSMVVTGGGTELIPLLMGDDYAMATLFLGGINGRIFFGLLIIGAVAAVGLVVLQKDSVNI